MTGAVVFAQEPAQADKTLPEAPKPANNVSANNVSANEASANEASANEANDVEAVASDNEPGVLLTAHPKPAKRLNARERQMAKRNGGGNDKETTADGTKPMTAEAKSRVDNKAADKAEKAKEKAKLKASQKAQKADTKARKISAAKAAKAARG